MNVFAHKKGSREQDLWDFDARIKSVVGESPDLDYTVEPGILGVGVELVYEGGVYTRASTWGDHGAGEDVTANIKTILTVPLRLTQPKEGPSVPEFLEVRGLVYTEVEGFEKPADSAAESLRQADHRVTAKRPLNIFCCGVGEVLGPQIPTLYDMMISLQRWGLRVYKPLLKVCRTVPEIIEYCRFLEKQETEFPYEIVGALIRVNPLHLQARLGLNESGRPRWGFLLQLERI
jgi:DNA ligase (NAD+)